MSDKRTARIVRRYKDAGDWCTATIEARATVGGVYADLHFAGCAEPTEVINLWDYAFDTSELGWKRGELRAILLEWAADQDADELMWADAEDVAQLRKHPRRRWLLTYLVNAPLR